MEFSAAWIARIKARDDLVNDGGRLLLVRLRYQQNTGVLDLGNSMEAGDVLIGREDNEAGPPGNLQDLGVRRGVKLHVADGLRGVPRTAQHGSDLRGKVMVEQKACHLWFETEEGAVVRDLRVYVHLVALVKLDRCLYGLDW